MNKVALLVAAGMIGFGSFTSAYAATPMSDADCTAMMTSMDKNADGSIAMDEGKPMFDKLTEMKKTTATANVMTKDEFMTECKTGDFEGMKAQ